MRPRYPKPFEGSPGVLSITGLFLFDPSVELKLLGFPLRKAFRRIGKESLFKRMAALSPDIPWSSTNTVDEVLDVCRGTPAFDMILGVIQDEKLRRPKSELKGVWECFAEAAGTAPNSPTATQYEFLEGIQRATHVPQAFVTQRAEHDLILAIEHACKNPQRCMDEWRFPDAAAALAADPLMRHFLWPRALFILAASNPFSHLTSLKLSVALEVRLSLIALSDVVIAHHEGAGPSSVFANLLPRDDRPYGNPTRRFFQWMKEATGAQTNAALLDRDQAGGTVDISTIDRWSNGTHHPRPVTLKLLAKKWWNNPDHQPLWSRNRAARLLNFIGYYAEEFVKKGMPDKQRGDPYPLAPWPYLPFDYPDVESWMQGRYPFWLQFHRDRLCNSPNN